MMFGGFQERQMQKTDKNLIWIYLIKEGGDNHKTQEFNFLT